MSQYTRRIRRLPKSVRPEEWRELIRVIPKTDKFARISFLLAYGSGMRISEVMRCEPSHFREKSIFIPKSKYDVERVVPLPKGWKKEFLKVLPLKISTRSIQRRFDKYSKKANLNPEYTFHSLRHGFATRLVESGVPTNHIQSLLGHANLSTTSLYTTASSVDAIKSYEDLF